MASAITYKQSTDQDLKYPCINNGTYCSGSAVCNITIFSPINDVIINNSLMTNEFAWHNYTLNTTQTDTLGVHQVAIVCNDTGSTGYSTFEYKITKSGDEMSSSDILPVIIAMFGVIVVFIIVSIALSKNHPVISIVLTLVSIFLLNPALQFANLAIENMSLDERIEQAMLSFQQILPLICYGIVVYVIVYILIQVLQSFEMKKKARLEGLDT